MSAPRPEGMSDQKLAKIRANVLNEDADRCTFWCDANDLLIECDRLRADGATLLHRAEQAETTAGDAKREIDRLVVRCGEFSEAHAASFKALHTLSAALFDGEVDDYAALAEKIIGRVRQAEADGATLRERVEAALTADVLAELVRRMDAYFRKRTQPTERDRSVEESRSYLMAVLFPASAPKEPTL